MFDQTEATCHIGTGFLTSFKVLYFKKQTKKDEKVHTQSEVKTSVQSSSSGRSVRACVCWGSATPRS